MANEPPFDVWDGEELPYTGDVEASTAEEQAMHLDPDSETSSGLSPHWSELTEETAIEPFDELPVTYFPDEQPEGRRPEPAKEEREPDLEELLERQHYSFPRKG